MRRTLGKEVGFLKSGAAISKIYGAGCVRSGHFDGIFKFSFLENFQLFVQESYTKSWKISKIMRTIAPTQKKSFHMYLLI